MLSANSFVFPVLAEEEVLALRTFCAAGLRFRRYALPLPSLPVLPPPDCSALASDCASEVAARLPLEEPEKRLLSCVLILVMRYVSLIVLPQILYYTLAADATAPAVVLESVPEALPVAVTLVAGCALIGWAGPTKAGCSP